ncbi:MAG: GNAT family N-acetyltransferase [Clostridiales bacterium]|nr:GNAT family N-acetyltransferase [Clostridiales bacterium]
MKLDTKIYNVLPPEAMEIRTAVFVEEQGFAKEFDEVDDIAQHFVVFDDKTAVATCRLFEGEPHSYTVGRIAVIQSYRGRQVGADLLRTVERIVRRNKGRSLALHAQVAAQGFYEKQGYAPYGKADYEENCPHIWMRKELGP